MTTLFGLRHPKTDLAVLVADRQTTSTDLRTGFPIGKQLGRKLWVSKEGNYCLGHSGLRDNQTEDFIGNILEGRYNISEIIQQEKFEELRDLNIQRMGYEMPNPERLSSFLIATRFDNNPKLYTCFPLGKVEERSLVAIGSGSQRVNEYMNALDIISEAKDYLPNGKGIEPGDLIQIGLEAVRRAQSKDVYSHGLDMMVCTPGKIIDHSVDLGDNFYKKLRNIQKQY